MMTTNNGDIFLGESDRRATDLGLTGTSDESMSSTTWKSILYLMESEEFWDIERSRKKAFSGLERHSASHSQILMKTGY